MGPTRDRALFADPDRRGSIPQGLKSEICQCGFLMIGSLSPGHIVHATHFLSIGSKHFTLYCYANNNSKYERCDSAHAAIAAVAVAIAAAAAQRKRTAAAAAAQWLQRVSTAVVVRQRSGCSATAVAVECSRGGIDRGSGSAASVAAAVAAAAAQCGGGRWRRWRKWRQQRRWKWQRQRIRR